jgi:hypothetical protein
MERLEQMCQRRRMKRLSREWVKDHDEFARLTFADERFAERINLIGRNLAVLRGQVTA